MTEADMFSNQPNLVSSPAADRQSAPALLLVSTPIGNLKDMSFRAREALEQVDAILCEDTRTSGVLMAAHGIKTKLIALHDHNEEARAPGLIAAMQAGARYALISDAGTPLLSDPGYRLTRAAIDAGLHVGGIPGANAAVLALTLSGLPPHPFLFSGFLPVKAGPRQTALTRLANAEAAGLAATLIFYEAPHRLAETLADAAAIFGDRPAAVCRELTKHFEEVVRDTLPNLATRYAVTPPRGEITLVIGPATVEPTSAESLDAALQSALAQLSLKDAVDAVTAATGLPRRQVYTRALELSKKQ
ncbi:MAG: 16S rRNA (cytidine(1402)-2'-O)-methyltransferase [Acidocella sp. 20-57-95]|nr:MAG: 16S rRNA (cytidine(1402)-2'-O)-methyltransferase [Acidocella sp. 20-57-95]OYV62182.1 MAG: 16S rRNA (cytidine(1402)-2'-O)-methyltransferase [Acidocella sp. 21-58-7]HQT63633.1 16S rRNA (cytidine(1402)-2'-O)-methyltransferase [Acidocella sp.]HQU04006.1 16S rRNA (cytidine(1402)-2'-O)-methyltransferase [Acidocella sp.]